MTSTRLNMVLADSKSDSESILSPTPGGRKMQFELRKRKDWNSNAVSEIIGNILILMITVVLFSSIMAFVNQMPVPELQTKADFAAGISFTESGTAAKLTVTHIGGAALLPRTVAVLLAF